MTQEEAAEALEPYIGSRWSKATWSAAERSVTGQRIRQFTADEILAFARAFGEPVDYFFLPPARDPEGHPILVAHPDALHTGVGPAELIDVLTNMGHIYSRLSQLFGDGPKALMPHEKTEWQLKWGHITSMVAAQAAEARLHTLARHATALREVAEALDHLDHDVRGELRELLAKEAAVSLRLKGGRKR